MKQYDKVIGTKSWVDKQGGHWEERKHENVIVLNAEELKEIWEAAREYECDERMANLYNRQNFDNYLKSKDITL